MAVLFKASSKLPAAGVLRILLLLATATVSTSAHTFWTGQTVAFSHPAASSIVDELTTNHVGADFTNNVWLTRGTSKPLYNAAAEPGWNGLTSPVNTLWAVASGPLTNANTLTYDTFANVVGQPGNSPSFSVGQTFFVYIVSDDIYLQLTLTEWGASDGGSFSYTRSTPPPIVSLVNPADGSVFAAPALLKLDAATVNSSGTVTNVQFFADATSLGSVNSAPFNLTSSPLPAGTYVLSAVASTGAGILATSSPVNISVVIPENVSLSGPQVAGGQFQFNYNVNTGLTYVVQSSSNLLNWTPVATNTPATTPMPFSTSLNPQGATYYRIGLLPNP